MAAGDHSNRSDSGCHRMGKAITTAIVWLLLGAIINIAVAWGFARGSNTGNLTMTSLAPVRGNSLILVDPDLSWLSSLPRDWPQPYTTLSARSPGFLLWTAQASTDRAASWGAQVFRFGWPCLAMEWHMLREQPQVPPGGINAPRAPWIRRWSLDVSRWLPPRGSRADQQVGLHQHLPLLPVWPGFAINTVFYAFVLWLIFIVPFAMRRRRRIKRGLCPKCAYDLRNRPSDSAVCPECGTPVTQPNMA